MKSIKVRNTNLEIPEIGLGCMRINGLQDQNEITRLIDTALENGINFFDHADIYGAGTCEELFSQSIKHINREEIILQSKCSIRPGIAFDFSKDYILTSVDKILKRLDTDYLDILLLHRPDTLMDLEELAEAFETLKSNGKVKYFGVSNQNSMQIELINAYCNNAVLFDQLQFSIAHCDIIDSGFNVNITNDLASDRSVSIIEYARLKGITLQAWSPFQYGFFEGVFIDNPKFHELNVVLDRLAAKYNVSKNAIAVAWILRHPAKIQTIVGTTNRDRLAQIAKASEITITKEEWYELYMAAGKKLP